MPKDRYPAVAETLPRRVKRGLAETPAAAAKSQRIEMRVTAVQKALFERAASVAGMSLTDFAIASLQGAATEALELHERTVVGAKYVEAVARALLRPPAPNAKLRAAAKRYKARTAP